MVRPVIQHIQNKITKAELQEDPFKHLVIENFIPEKYGRKIAEAYPGPDSEYWSVNKSSGQTVGNKMMSMKPNSDVLLPPRIRDLIYFLNGQTITNILGAKFGFEEKTLMADTQLCGAGLHSIGKDGFLHIHADFNYHPTLSIHRRLNLLLYLNYDWKEEWGGDVELWDTECKEMKVKVPPFGGHCVIFETNDNSYHGHPHPLTCPEEARRNSIALYYYTFPEICKPIIDENIRTTDYHIIAERKKWRKQNK